MIGCFPDAYPDELLYSLCARFHQRVQYPNKRNTILELFGDSASVATIDLPNNLGHLVSMLPESSHYTVDYVINNHTLLPFYAPFLSLSQVENLRIDMESSGNTGIHMRSGLIPSTIQPPQWLKYCSECVKEDTHSYGECYWHRLHQLPGVEVCPKHKVFLVNSQVRTHNPQNRYEFISADRVIQPLEYPRIVENSLQHQTLLKIAENAGWLLENYRTTVDLEVLTKRYRKLLADRDLATYSGRVRVSKLLQEFIQFYGSEFLKELQCEIDTDSQHNWLNRIVRFPKGSQHPVRHLLLIQFLGHTVESFLSMDNFNLPFGKGLWPCLNRAARHYGQRVISRCNISYSSEHGKPIGKFSCSCGFIYARTGPDTSEEDCFKITKIIQFGSEWEASLRKGWSDSTLSLRALARQLGVDAATVKLHAARLGLLFPRQGRRQTNKSHRTLKGHSQGAIHPSLDSLDKYRNEWLTIIASHPNTNRTTLKRQFLRVYMWLWRNDRDWLEANQPARRNSSAPLSRVDWQQRDAELAVAVAKTAQRLKGQETRPTQLTIATIARESGHLALIQKHLDKLPVTEATLLQWVETREQFALRRIEWVYNCYRNERLVPPRWKFIRRSGLRPDIQILPQVQDIIDKKLQFLQNSITKSS